MLGSSILDVAIGMAFIYLLLSLIASTVQEAIASIVQTRSANLAHAIQSLFSGGTLEAEAGKEGKPLLDLIYTHGLIRGLYRDPKQDTPKAGAPVTKDSPFRDRLRRFFHIHPVAPIAGVSDHFLLPAYIPARTFAITLIDILDPALDNGKTPLENIDTRLRALLESSTAAGAGATAPPPVKNNAAEAILALLADAKNAKDYTATAIKFQQNLEKWYNDAMDRASGWYKNYTQKVLIVIGLLLAIAFNVDSVHVARTLWFDRDTRQGLVSAADSWSKVNTKLPVGAAPGAEMTVLAGHMESTIQAFNNVSSRYLLPVGWPYSRADYIQIVKSGRWSLAHVLEQIAGWLTTAIALSLGAPFWFDTLNKFMVVRSTVKPQEKSQNEPSKS